MCVIRLLATDNTAWAGLTAAVLTAAVCSASLPPLPLLSCLRTEGRQLECSLHVTICGVCVCVCLCLCLYLCAMSVCVCVSAVVRVCMCVCDRS